MAANKKKFLLSPHHWHHEVNLRRATDTRKKPPGAIDTPNGALSQKLFGILCPSYIYFCPIFLIRCMNTYYEKIYPDLFNELFNVLDFGRPSISGSIRSIKMYSLA